MIKLLNILESINSKIKELNDANKIMLTGNITNMQSAVMNFVTVKDEAISAIYLYKNTPAAIPTFNDSALPYMGIISFSFAILIKSLETPCPSFPNIIAFFSFKLILSYEILSFSRAVTRILNFSFNKNSDNFFNEKYSILTSPISNSLTKSLSISSIRMKNAYLPSALILLAHSSNSLVFPAPASAGPSGILPAGNISKTTYHYAMVYAASVRLLKE